MISGNNNEPEKHKIKREELLSKKLIQKQLKIELQIKQKKTTPNNN